MQNDARFDGLNPRLNGHNQDVLTIGKMIIDDTYRSKFVPLPMPRVKSETREKVRSRTASRCDLQINVGMNQM